MEIVIKIFGFLFAALMIYGGFKMLSRGQYQTQTYISRDKNINNDNKNNEILNSDNKKES